MAERYRVTLHSQMGPREGILTLDHTGDYVSGLLELMGYGNAVQGVLAGDGTIHIFHPIRTAVRTISCETVLELQEGQLKGVTRTKPCRIQWEGVLLSHDA